MYSNYFKTAWRNLLKHPFYSFINMVGLGLGLIAVFFIFLHGPSLKAANPKLSLRKG